MNYGEIVRHLSKALGYTDALEFKRDWMKLPPLDRLDLVRGYSWFFRGRFFPGNVNA